MPVTRNKGGAKFDEQRYGELLGEALPVWIERRSQHRRLLTLVERLMDKGAARSLEEDMLLDLLAYLIADYEQRVFQPRKATPHEILREMMAANEVKQSDLVSVLKSKSSVSEIVNGKRGISKANANALAEFFHLPVEVFL